MAGTISLSLSQQFDADGRPLSGGKLYFFESGSTTPQSAYSDTDLAPAHELANPIVLDASGRVPAFYLADGRIKIRLDDVNDVTVISADDLLVIGPSAEPTIINPTVDENALLTTGDIKARYGTGSLSGFVRCNGRTIGSGSSGATERANADAQDLFEYLWAADANLTVSGGRSGSANTDFLADKTIALPDLRGRVLAGMDDMGATAASRLTATYFGAAATALGAVGGGESHTLLDTELPSHRHTVEGDTTEENSNHTHDVSGTTGAATAAHDHFLPVLQTTAGFAVGALEAVTDYAGTIGADTTGDDATSHTHNFTATSGIPLATHTHTISLFTSFFGAGDPLNVVQGTMVATFYMKL